MYKVCLTADEIQKMKKIWYATTSSYEEKAQELYNIISYDDLMRIVNWYISLGVNLIEDEGFKDLSTIRTMYIYCDSFGWFDSCKQLEQKIERITNNENKVLVRRNYL